MNKVSVANSRVVLLNINKKFKKITKSLYTSLIKLLNILVSNKPSMEFVRNSFENKSLKSLEHYYAEKLAA